MCAGSQCSQAGLSCELLTSQLKSEWRQNKGVGGCSQLYILTILSKAAQRYRVSPATSDACVYWVLLIHYYTTWMNVLKGCTRTGTEDKHVMYTNTGTDFAALSTRRSCSRKSWIVSHSQLYYGSGCGIWAWMMWKVSVNFVRSYTINATDVCMYAYVHT